MERGGQRPAARQAGHQVGDDVIAERRVERVGVVAEGVRGVELVAVLAVDEPVGLGLEAGRVEQCSVLRPGGRRRRPVPAVWHPGDAQEVEEVAGEHELDGSRVRIEFVEQ
jgi:hypothetical protein